VQLDLPWVDFGDVTLRGRNTPLKVHGLTCD
jgi:hypothetical protein